jgi:membrane protein involved in colicin uptake
MKKLGSLLLGMFAVLPVYAQDQAADTTAPAEAAPADAAPAADASAPAADAAAPADAAAAPADASAAPASADAAPAGDTPPADATASAPAADAAAPTDSAPAADAASTDAAASGSTDSSAAPADASASAEAAPAEAAAAAPAGERKPWQLYAGYDYAMANFLASSSNSPSTPNKANQFSSDNLHGSFHQIRAGVRVFDVIGIEAHYGIKAGSEGQPSSMGIKNNMGLYFVPTGTLFDVVEISALIGYASTKLEHGGNTLSVHGSSYGANLEVPLRPLLGEWMPDIRVGGGFMVYHHDSESRIYGSHFGLRYDFKV